MSTPAFPSAFGEVAHCGGEFLRLFDVGQVRRVEQQDARVGDAGAEDLRVGGRRSPDRWTPVMTSVGAAIRPSSSQIGVAQRRAAADVAVRDRTAGHHRLNPARRGRLALAEAVGEPARERRIERSRPCTAAPVWTTATRSVPFLARADLRGGVRDDEAVHALGGMDGQPHRGQAAEETPQTCARAAPTASRIARASAPSRSSV